MNDQLAARVKMLRAQGLTNPQIGQRLGISRTHVSRLLNPRSYEVTLRTSREAKRRRIGTCEVCGGVTRLGRHGQPSRICADCVAPPEKWWTRERIIEAIQRWAQEHGSPPRSTDWTAGHPDRLWPAKSNVYLGTRNKSAPFATWADAIEAAGFPRPRRGYYKRTPEVRARMADSQRKRRSRERVER